MESFAPTIHVNDETVTPKGYVWILGFSLAGCDWALEKANKPEFREMVKADLKKEKVIELEKAIERYESRINEIRSEIEDYT